MISSMSWSSVVEFCGWATEGSLRLLVNIRKAQMARLFKRRFRCGCEGDSLHSPPLSPTPVDLMMH